jgi:hypothetical protein
MFASAAEYYRQHPNGDLSNDDGNEEIITAEQEEDQHGDEDHANDDEKTVDPTLRISGSMFLEDALDRIRDTLNDETNPPMIRRFTCLNLGLDGLLFDEDELEDTLLARLTLSRNWEAIELHACRRVGVLLDLLLLGNEETKVRVHTLLLTGGQAMSWDDVRSISRAIPHTKLHTLHLSMTFPKLPAPFSVTEYMDLTDSSSGSGSGRDNDSESDSSQPDDDPSMAMQILISGMQTSSLNSLELYLSRRDLDTFSGGLSSPLMIRSSTAPPRTPFLSLHRLDLRQSFLGDDLLAQLVDSIVSLLASGGQLRFLDLRGHCECQSQMLQSLTQPSTASLHQLWISNTILTEDRMDGLESFFRSLSSADPSTSSTLVSSLQTLDIGNYMIGDIDMEALMVSLTAPNSTLQSLDLLSCGMTSTGMALWEEGLSRISTLQRLAIPADASHNILRGLVLNISLRALNLEDRASPLPPLYVGTTTNRPLCRRPHDLWLDLNRGGRRLLRMTRDVQAGLWPLVLERAQSSSVVSEYYGGPNQALTVLWVLLRNRVMLEQR